MRAILLALTASALAAETVPSLDSRNTDVPHTNTRFKMPEYKTLAEWEARKKQLRTQILFAAGLDPMPERPAPRAEVFGRIENKDYSIEKVLLETRPGYYLGGNLYRPLGRGGKFPGIASPHGHWNYGRLEHTPLGSIPARCINLARQGYVVFAYDMVGYNDTVQTPHSFGNRLEQLWGFGPLGLQLWNSLRVVDFLVNFPEVDASRIGATGASGGGTQSFLLAAVDDRVQYAAPVNMISFIMQGGSPCENAPGLRVGANNVEFASMIAPRPLLMVSATGDWTRNTLEEEHPAVKRIYELYDKTAMLEAVRIDAPHNYNKESREAVYKFFAKHILKDRDTDRYTEQNIRVEKLADMLALHNRTLPAGALNFEGVFSQWRSIVTKQMDAIRDNAERRRLLSLALGSEWPSEVTAEQNGEAIVLTRTRAKDRVPGVFVPGQGKPILYVHANGAKAARESAEAKSLLPSKRPVLLIDAFQTGDAQADRNRNVPHYITFNRTEDAHRVQDILTAMRWLESKGMGIEVVAQGPAAVWSRFAAAVAPVKATLRLEAGSFSGTDQEFLDQFFVPGIQRAGGWKAALALTH